MGFFKKTSPAYEELLSVSSVLGTAVGKSAVGAMPADYVDFTVANQAATFQAKFAAYSAEAGAEKAWTQAERHAFEIAKIHADAMGSWQKQQLAERVNQVLLTARDFAANEGGTG